MSIEDYQLISQQLKAGKITPEEAKYHAELIKQKDFLQAEEQNRKENMRAGIGFGLQAGSFLTGNPTVGGALYQAGNAIGSGKSPGEVLEDTLYGGVAGHVGGKIVQKASPYVSKAYEKYVPQTVKTVLNTDIAKIPQTVKEVNKIKTTTQGGVVGTPKPFEKFSKEAIGSGEGNAVHGYGFYANKSDPISNPTAMDRATGYSKTRIEDRLNEDFGDVLNPYLSSYQKKLLISHPELANEILDETSGELLGRKLYYEGLERNGALTPYDKQDYNYVVNTYNRINELESILPNYIKNTKGVVYDVRMPNENVMLQEDKLLNQQPSLNLGSIYRENPDIVTKNLRTGGDLYKALTNKLGSKKAASDYLYSKGIKGVSYRGAADLDANVVFNEKDIFKTPEWYPTSAIDNPYEYALRYNMAKPNVNALTPTALYTGDAILNTLRSKLNEKE